MTAPTPVTVGATLARIKRELPADTDLNIDGLIADVFAVAKIEIDADVKTNAPHIPLVRGWIVAEGISIVDQTLDNTAALILDAVDASLKGN